MEKVDEYRKLCLSSLLKRLFTTTICKSSPREERKKERKKESMKVELTAFSGQRQTYEENGRVWTYIEFPSWLSVIVLTCFTGLRLVYETPFRIPSPKMGLANFRLSLHLRGLCSTPCLYLVTSSTNSLKLSRRLTSAWSRRENHIRFWWFHTSTKDLGPPCFFQSFLSIVVTRPWLADPQVP